MICSFHSKFPTQNPPRPTQKNPFHVQIKYDTTCNFTFCRRLADEGDSKSLVLITRVGSTPTTGIKKETLPACLGGFPFYLRRVSGSNSTALPSRASDQPCGLSLSARETPTTGIKKRRSCCTRIRPVQQPLLLLPSIIFISVQQVHHLFRRNNLISQHIIAAGSSF